MDRLEELKNKYHAALETIQREGVVKSNIRAVQFYQNQGWKVQREFPHEKFGHAMFQMTKSDRTSPTP